MYCKDTKRRDEAEHTSFDFLGYTFRGRLARGRRGFFVSFSPAMSPKAKKAIGKQIEASRKRGFWVCWCRLGASCHEECAGGEVVGVGEAVGAAA